MACPTGPYPIRTTSNKSVFICELLCEAYHVCSVLPMFNVCAFVLQELFLLSPILLTPLAPVAKLFSRRRVRTPGPSVPVRSAPSLSDDEPVAASLLLR